MATSSSSTTQVQIPTRLIIVCCNSIYTGSPNSSPSDESNWLLKPFQQSSPTKQGEHLTFIRHILAAVSLYSESPETSIIAFSGGPTSHAHPTLSEAQSYFHVFQKSLDPNTQSEVDILLEENATDSYQNILFSVLLFRKRYDTYPRTLTVVAHSFKEPRFLHLHAKALRWPLSLISVHGIDPPFTGKCSFLCYALRYHQISLLQILKPMLWRCAQLHVDDRRPVPGPQPN
jgi:hypothetical protein